MPRLRWVLWVATSAVITFAAASSPAQVEAPDALFGEWTLVPSVREGRARITQAFEHALADNAMMRAVAMQQIDTDAMLARRIEISAAGERIVTTMHTAEVHRFRSRLGYPTPVTAENGRDAQLTQLVRQGRLELVFDLDLGRRWTVLEPHGDGRLRLTTTIDPRMIDRNVRFVLEYRRTSR